MPDNDDNQSKASREGLIRRFYHWVLSWSESRYGGWALALVAFTESSFFLVPPDALLIPLCLGKPGKSYRFALISTLASTLGGLFGYFLGWRFGRPLFQWLADFCHFESWAGKVEIWYNSYDALIVFVAGFTPIPFKVFTVLGGVMSINIFVFAAASLLSRGARYYLIGWLCKRFGNQSTAFIERHFQRLIWISSALLALAVILWLVLHN